MVGLGALFSGRLTLNEDIGVLVRETLLSLPSLKGVIWAGLFAIGVCLAGFGLLEALFFPCGVTRLGILVLMGERTVLRYSNLKDLSPIVKTSLLRMYTSLERG